MGTTPTGVGTTEPIVFRQAINLCSIDPARPKNSVCWLLFCTVTMLGSSFHDFSNENPCFYTKIYTRNWFCSGYSPHYRHKSSTHSVVQATCPALVLLKTCTDTCRLIVIYLVCTVRRVYNKTLIVRKVYALTPFIANVLCTDTKHRKNMHRPVGMYVS